jgi:[ribosomal protein S5]-alanine N-acetyltransferase
MNFDKQISSERLYLRNLQSGDATRAYVDWMNNKEVVQYLECRFQPPQTKKSILKFIKENNDSSTDALFGIFLHGSNVHIGNVRISSICYFHHRADLGYLIANEKYRGLGYATEAVTLISEFCKETLKLKIITAACYDVNVASEKVLVKSGFQKCGMITNHADLNGYRVSSILFGKSLNV